MLFLSGSAPAADLSKDDYQGGSADFEANYETNASATSSSAPSTLPNAELQVDLEVWKGTAFGMQTGENRWWNIQVGAELDLRLSLLYGGMSQAMPQLYLLLLFQNQGWQLTLLARGTYRYWVNSEPTAIEPEGALNLMSPAFWSSEALASWFNIQARYKLTDRISRADQADTRQVYQGVTNSGRILLAFHCPGTRCPGVVPDAISLSYTLTLGDFVSVGPATADVVAVASATAPSTLFDSGQALGYNAYRVSGVSHELTLRIQFNRWFYAIFSHRVLLAGAGFQAVDDRAQLGLGF